MEMSEMKQAWQQLDEKLNRQNTLQLALLREKHLDNARSKLRPLFWGMALQIVLGLVSVMIAAPFWLSNLSVPVLWVSGVILHVYGLLAMVLAGRIMIKINRLDMSAPVLAIQRQLIELKKSHITSGWVIGLPWWVLWLPYTIVLQHEHLGLFTDHVPQPFISIAIICAILMVITLVVVVWAQNPRRPQRAAKIEAMLAGVSLTSAQQSLDELLRFEQNEPA